MDYAAVEPIVDAITPVPGGVGSVTTSVLVGHVVEAADVYKRQDLSCLWRFIWRLA